MSDAHLTIDRNPELSPLALKWTIVRNRAEKAIEAKAAEQAGVLGAPVGDIAPTHDGRGQFKPFEHGHVVRHADRGVFVVHGAIFGRWVALGGTASFLGYPVTDELPCPAGPGRFSHFEHGSIYWSPATDARLVYGAIRDHWASQGWEQGALGLPTTDEEDVPGAPGARRNVFEGGIVTWTPAAGARTTALFNVDPNANPAGLHVLSHHGGDVPAPQVSRHIIASVSMSLTDHETFSENEHGTANASDNRWVDSWDPQQVLSAQGVAGGEMRVEVSLTASIRADGSAKLTGTVKLFEGTSVTTNDLDGTRDVNVIVPVDQVTSFPINIRNDDEGDDHAELNITVSNSST